MDMSQYERTSRQLPPIDFEWLIFRVSQEPLACGVIKVVELIVAGQIAWEKRGDVMLGCPLKMQRVYLEEPILFEKLAKQGPVLPINLFLPIQEFNLFARGASGQLRL